MNRLEEIMRLHMRGFDRARVSHESRRWRRFERDLNSVIRSLGNEQFLIISAKRAHRFVQFARGPVENGTSELRAEAVSNNYLERRERLTRRQLSGLVALGWSVPTHGGGEEGVTHGSSNYFCDFPEPFPCARIARMSVRTLSDVFRVGCPDDLQYESFQEPGGNQVVWPTLRIERAPPLTAAMRPTLEQSVDNAKAIVLEAIRKAAGNDSLSYDEDGDIGVSFGTATLLVRVDDPPRLVRVYSPIVTRLELGEPMLRRLNELNAGAKVVRVLFADGIIWASADVFMDPLVPEHVLHACHAVGEVAKDLRESLRREFRDRTVMAPNTKEFKN